MAFRGLPEEGAVRRYCSLFADLWGLGLGKFQGSGFGDGLGANRRSQKLPETEPSQLVLSAWADAHDSHDLLSRLGYDRYLRRIGQSIRS